jgi:lipid-binding SYLF domain-containing protein
MTKRLGVALLAIMVGSAVLAEDDAAYSQALKNFQDQPAAAEFFSNSVGYALFPTIGQGGIGIGGAFGKGRVFKGGAHTHNVKMAQLTIGLQLGGQAYSEIIFFKNEDAYNTFINGDFEFGADASAVALTASAQASASTKGTTASAATSAENAADSAAEWVRGMAVFTIAKGGLMYQATIGGQAFDVEPL